jgi:2-polyprenyl-3-methyl-5-hydroxy-6-metoxy-1,4-benzoquinol methylase
MSDGRPAAPQLKRHPRYGYRYYDAPPAAELEAHYARKYFQENEIYSADYSQAEIDYVRSAAARKVALVEVAAGGPLGEGFQALEIGVGEGWSLAALAAAGASVQGIDFSSYALEKRNPALRSHLKVGHPEATLQALIDANRRFDLVWLDNVLEHVPDAEAFLARVRHALAPSGLLLAEVPNDGSALHGFLLETELVSREFWLAYPEHLSYFTPESLGALLSGEGFEVLDMLGDFPIDLFLLNDAANYVENRATGKAAHRARIRFEELLGRLGTTRANAFFRAAAEAGFGRNLLVLARKAGDYAA